MYEPIFLHLTVRELKRYTALHLKISPLNIASVRWLGRGEKILTCVIEQMTVWLMTYRFTRYIYYKI